MAPRRSAHRRDIVITGASAGLGREIARQLVQAGLAQTLVLIARRTERLDQLANSLRTLDHTLTVHTIAADLAEPAATERLAAAILERMGGVDLLINNAGLGLPTLFSDAPPAQLRNQLEVNFAAPLLLTRQLLPSLENRRGTIINIGSAITCVANSALGAYGATKAGLAYWNDALRRELSPRGVRVCLVEPGPFPTEFMDAVHGRLAPGQAPHPILHNASPWMSTRVEDVAARVVRLVEHPRRRVSVTRRFVWLFRFLGALATLCPPLGDAFVIALSKPRASQAEQRDESRSTPLTSP